ncbi:hypothetical protein AB4Y36_03550 [Paraburkholderia sp. BR10936]|uniref:hypothetical protein n=1 Tax=Paraburkholderia sp. BR10936 TaxID=3236993 RepID=UPI0034D32F81
MREMHYFQYVDPRAHQFLGYTQEMIADAKALKEEVDDWIQQWEICGCLETPLVEHRGEHGIWGVVAPAYAFYELTDAVAFKLVFGDKFEYSVYDSDDLQ